MLDDSIDTVQRGYLDVNGQDQLHLSDAGIALCHSFRMEQTAVLGFLLAIDKVLSALQRAFLETTSYPWSPEWLKLCELICRKRGQEPFEFPTFGNEQLDLPILPARTAFQVTTWCVFSFNSCQRDLFPWLCCCHFCTLQPIARWPWNSYVVCTRKTSCRFSKQQLRTLELESGFNKASSCKIFLSQHCILYCIWKATYTPGGWIWAKFVRLSSFFVKPVKLTRHLWLFPPSLSRVSLKDLWFLEAIIVQLVSSSSQCASQGAHARDAWLQWCISFDAMVDPVWSWELQQVSLWSMRLKLLFSDSTI